MRVGLVGCGRIAERGYLPALGRAGASLVAVADPDRQRCTRLAPDVPWFPSASDLLEREPVDLLVVASPASAHLDDARAAAAAGVRALVEKPPAPDARSAAALSELVPTPWIGFNRRFESRLVELREALARHDQPLRMDVLLTTRPSAWGAYVSRDGPLLDLGSHAVDLASWLGRRSVERVRSSGRGDEHHELELDLGDSTAHVVVAHDRGWRESVLAHAGGRPVGEFAVGGLVGRLRARIGAGRGASLPELLARQLRAAARALSDGEDGELASAGEGERVMAALDAAYRSELQGGAWVDVDRVPVTS